MPDLNTLSEKLTALTDLQNLGDNMFAMVFLIGISVCVALLLLMKVLFISMKKADAKRLSDFYHEIEQKNASDLK